MTHSQDWGTVQFASVITEAEMRWRNKVLPEIQTSTSFQARSAQDPILREARVVLTAASKEEAVEAAKRLRGRWFPFHGLNENGEKRRAWLSDLQEATAAEARKQGASEERVKYLLGEQGVWLAVMRSPMKSTAPPVWKQAQMIPGCFRFDGPETGGEVLNVEPGHIGRQPVVDFVAQ